MSPREKLTPVGGCRHDEAVFVLDVVRRLKAAPTSSREQMSTESNY